MQEPTNQEDEFTNEKEREQAYKQAAEKLENRMRDKHGDIR